MAATSMAGSSCNRAPSGMQSDRVESPSVFSAGGRTVVAHTVSLCRTSACGMTPARISATRTTPASREAPAPVLPPPQPEPASAFVAPQLVAHPLPLRWACQYSSIAPAVRSTTTIAPSLPTLGRASVGIGRGLPANGQGPQSVTVHPTW